MLWNRSLARRICREDRGRDLRIQMHFPSRDTDGVEMQAVLTRKPKNAQMMRGVSRDMPGMSARNSSTCSRNMAPATANARIITSPSPMLVRYTGLPKNRLRSLNIRAWTTEPARRPR